ATGKWHNGPASLRRAFQRGRSLMLGGMCDHNAVPLVDLDPASHTLVGKRVGDRRSSVLFADAALAMLGEHRRDRPDAPFFLYVAFTAPHDPRDPPPDLAGRARERPPLPRNFLPQVPWFADRSWGHLRDEVLAAWPRTEAVVRDQLAEYYGLIAELDQQIGRILGALDDGGAARDTIVVFAADHGLALGSHGLLGKQSVFEHSMGCPLAIAGPGIPRGETRPALVYLLDLFPTLCGVGGAVVGEGVEGRDLMPVVRGESTGVRDSLFTMYAATQRAVRDQRFELVRFPEIDTTLLFDLQQDPDECVDLSARPEHRATLLRLRRELEGWQERSGDGCPWVVAKPRPVHVDLSGRPRKPDRWQPEWIRRKYFGVR
ncbi:MAG: sulfatase-like hydrolase/transferase, partial [Planctomycetes bacterium]|nr:sulfatase-like hydrolase/transferase [Planctomycetota bacterium]